MSENGTVGQGCIGNLVEQVGGCLLQVLAIGALMLLCGGGFETLFAYVVPFVLPAPGTLLVGWIFPKVAPERLQFLRLAVAVQSGILSHLVLAQLTATFYLDETPTYLLWEVGAVSGVLAWLVARPGVIPAILLIAYNVFAVVVGVMRFSAADAESVYLSSVLALFLYAGLAVYFLAGVVGTLWKGRATGAAAVLDVKDVVAETVGAIRADVYAGLGLPAPRA